MFYKLNEYLQLPKQPSPWVIESLIPVGGLVNIYGKPKTGKSFIALGMAQAIANGDQTWEGYEIQNHGPVAYLQVDTPREEWSRRLDHVRKACAQNDVPLWIADMWLIPEYPMDLLNEDNNTIQWLKNELDKIKPVLVIIDTLREVHSGDEDSSTVMRNVISSIVGACKPAAIMLVSHARKDSVGWDQDVDMMDQARGSSYVAGRMDVIIQVRQKTMKFKGRATGEVHEKIVQDPETGFIHIQYEEDGSDTAIRDIMGKEPGLSVHAYAEKLGKKMGYSVSTATRRIKKWQVVNKKE
jgi:RecA-family ATPase